MKYISILSIVCLSLLANDSYALRHKKTNPNSSQPTIQQLNTIQTNTNTNGTQHNIQHNTQQFNTIQTNTNTNNIQPNTQVNSSLNNLFQSIDDINTNSNDVDSNEKVIQNEKNLQIDRIVSKYFDRNLDSENEITKIKNYFEEYKKCINVSKQISYNIQELGKLLDNEDNKEVFVKGGTDSIIGFMSKLNDNNEAFINYKNNGLQALKNISYIHNFANKRSEISNID